jgi:hypothetical protein
MVASSWCACSEISQNLRKETGGGHIFVVCMGYEKWSSAHGPEAPFWGPPSEVHTLYPLRTKAESPSQRGVSSQRISRLLGVKPQCSSLFGTCGCLSPFSTPHDLSGGPLIYQLWTMDVVGKWQVASGPSWSWELWCASTGGHREYDQAKEAHSGVKLRLV